uniref:SSD domain-containing protein n=1 Tax=Romanomermis culicivorax TaxID=13658 RepID=A0A915K9B5_ROMCU
MANIIRAFPDFSGFRLKNVYLVVATVPEAIRTILWLINRFHPRKMRCLNNILEDFFFSYATVVTKYAYFFVVVPLCLTGLLGSGFYFLNKQNENDTEYVFTPTNGRWKYEYATFKEHFPLDENNHVVGQSFEVKRWIHLIATGHGPENKNLLRKDILTEIEDLNDYILNKLTVLSFDGMYKFFYRDICLKIELQCFDNSHVTLLKHRDELEDNGNLIRYPVMRIPYDRPIYLGGFLGLVKYDEDGWMEEVGAIRLIYELKSHPETFDFYSIQFRDHVTDYLLSHYPTKLINVAFGNDDSLNQGLRENTVRFAPEISVTIILVFIFSLICSFVLHKNRVKSGYVIDWVRSKPLLSIIGIVEPGMAIISAFGLLLLAGAPYNDVLVVMPFLVFEINFCNVSLFSNVAIGVDDMFIQISAWHCTKFEWSAEDRFAEALSESAVAITITSVTDIISFLVGTWNPLPAMQMFCYYTALAMFFELLYQCTFYSAALYLLGKVETEGRHSITMKEILPTDKAGNIVS